MRILHVYKDYAPILGGIENHIRALAEAQAAEGHDVRVLVTRRRGDRDRETANAVAIERVPSLGTVASTPLSPALFAHARSSDADLIHLHSPYPIAEIAMLGPRRAPYVITLHAEPTRPLQRLILWAYRPVFQRIVDGAAALLVTSPQAAARARWFRATDPRVAVVPLGSDPERFHPASTRAGTSDQPLRVLFAGLLRHYKGVDVLLRALPLVERPIALTVAGAGPEAEPLRLLSHQLGLEGQVRFLGRVPDEDLADLYRGHDVFVLPAVSPAEAFGQVLVEAMLSGLPCITTELGTGTSFVVQEGVTGRVVAPRAARQLASALRELADSSELRARLGQAGRARALEHFTTTRMLADVRVVYARVAGAHAHRERR